VVVLIGTCGSSERGKLSGGSRACLEECDHADWRRREHLSCEGNCSGRGREWVRSNKPHLLQSWRIFLARGEREKKRDIRLCQG
jgi:hypothetical protein